MWVAKRGRPKSEDPANNITSVRLTDSEHQVVKKAADRAELPLGQYMRAVIVEVAQFDISRSQQVSEHPDTNTTDTEQTNTRPQPKMSEPRPTINTATSTRSPH